MCLEFCYGVVSILSLFSYSLSLSFSLLFLSSQLRSLVFLNWPDVLSVFQSCHSPVCLFLRFVFSGLLFSLFLIFLYCAYLLFILDLSYSSNSKESACSAGDLSSIPGSERSSGEGNGNLLQYSWLENPMDREAWWSTVCGVTQSRTWLSNYHFHSPL